MKDASMSLEIYFEIKDAELYGGEGTTGYAATIVEISIEGLQNADFEKYADSQLEAMASMAKVPKEKVRIISEDEYEENTEEGFQRNSQKTTQTIDLMTSSGESMRILITKECAAITKAKQLR